MALTLHPLLASDAAFAVIFGIFVVALAVLVVIVLTWAFRHDREGRAAWRQRQVGDPASREGDGPPTPGP
jgi:Mn2+/Fe2+ NRAMP family transporter